MIDNKFADEADTLEDIIAKIPSAIGNIQVTLLDSYMVRVLKDPTVLHKLFIEYTKDHLTSLTSSATNLWLLRNGSIHGKRISKESIIRGYLHLLNIYEIFKDRENSLHLHSSPNYAPMEKLLGKWKNVLIPALTQV